MKGPKLPQTDSIAELAVLHLEPTEVEEVKRSAEERGVEPSELLREWVLEKLDSMRP